MQAKSTRNATTTISFQGFHGVSLWRGTMRLILWQNWDLDNRAQVHISPNVGNGMGLVGKATYQAFATYPQVNRV